MRLRRFFTIFGILVFTVIVIFYFVQFFTSLSSALHLSNIKQEDATITEHLGQEIPAGLTFKDSSGENVALGSLRISERPTLLVPVYYGCPRLCSLTLNGFSEMLKELDLKIGSDFNIVTFSFDDRETVDLARKKADNYRRLVLDNQPDVAKGWNFLVGGKQEISELMNRIGFSYSTSGAEIAHAAGFLVLSPSGVINRYFYGIQYEAEHVRFALVEAAEGKIGNTVDKVLLYCFQFDPNVGRYSMAIMNIVRAVSLLGLGIFILALLSLWLKDKKRGGEDAHA